jgi:hypothetical protein
LWLPTETQLVYSSRRETLAAEKVGFGRAH